MDCKEAGLYLIRCEGKETTIIAFLLHIPFAVLTIFWTRLRPRPLDRANSAFGLRHARSPFGLLP